MALSLSLTQFAYWTGLAAVESVLNSETGLACRYSVYFDQCFQISFSKFSTQNLFPYSVFMCEIHLTNVLSQYLTLSILEVKNVLFSLLDFSSS